MKAGKRLASLAHLLLIFREHEYRPEHFDINGVILELQTFISRILGPQVRFSTSLQSGILPVNTDLSHIKRVLLTLAFEMRAVMPDEGQLTISTDSLLIPDGSAEIANLAPGPYVRIAVRSSGQIPSTIFESITAASGSGVKTALRDMSLSEIVEICGGHLFQCSKTGQLSAIRIYLPAG